MRSTCPDHKMPPLVNFCPSLTPYHLSVAQNKQNLQSTRFLRFNFINLHLQCIRPFAGRVCVRVTHTTDAPLVTQGKELASAKTTPTHTDAHMCCPLIGWTRVELEFVNGRDSMRPQACGSACSEDLSLAARRAASQLQQSDSRLGGR